MPLTEKGEEIKSNMENEYGKGKGESVFYASKNKGTIHGVDELPSMDAIPIPDCWRTGDEAPAYNSVPLISPTAIGGLPTQPSGMHEPSDEAGLPGPHGEAAALKAGPLGPEPPPYSDVPNPLEGAGHGADAGATPPPPAHEGCDPAMSFDLLAAMGHGRRVDWSGDVSGLPRTVTQEQMVNFGASMNFGEGVTK